MRIYFFKLVKGMTIKKLNIRTEMIFDLSIIEIIIRRMIIASKNIPKPLVKLILYLKSIDNFMIL